jgi:hypothetical protein
MVHVSDLYGTSLLSMVELREKVERVLGVKFDPHDSAYMGGDYFRAGELGGGEEFVIQRNNFEFAGEAETAEPDYPDYSVMLQVSWTDRGDEIRNRLSDIRGLLFLRRQPL